MINSMGSEVRLRLGQTIRVRETSTGREGVRD